MDRVFCFSDPATVRNSDSGAFFGECSSNDSADSSAPTGDENGASVQSEIHSADIARACRSSLRSQDAEHRHSEPTIVRGVDSDGDWDLPTLLVSRFATSWLVAESDDT